MVLATRQMRLCDHTDVILSFSRGGEPRLNFVDVQSECERDSLETSAIRKHFQNLAKHMTISKSIYFAKYFLGVIIM